MSHLQASLTSNGKAEFLSLLREEGIRIEQRPLMPGVILAALETFDIVTVGVPLGTLAAVLRKWLAVRGSRTIIIQTKRNGVFSLTAKGYSADEVARLLKEASSIKVIQATRDDPETERDTDNA
jgi:hypothetical protein